MPSKAATGKLLLRDSGQGLVVEDAELGGTGFVAASAAGDRVDGGHLKIDVTQDQRPLEFKKVSSRGRYRFGILPAVLKGRGLKPIFSVNCGDKALLPIQAEIN